MTDTSHIDESSYSPGPGLCFDHADNQQVAQGRGRKRNDVWEYLTDAVDPQKLIAATCKHCHQLVTYRCKSERAKVHLLKCRNFSQKMQVLPPEDRPHWFIEPHLRSKKLKSVESSPSSMTHDTIMINQGSHDTKFE